MSTHREIPPVAMFAATDFGDRPQKLSLALRAFSTSDNQCFAAGLQFLVEEFVDEWDSNSPTI